MYLTKRLRSYPLPDGRALLINTLSGALDIVTADMSQALRRLSEGGEAVSLDSSFEAKLRARAYLFDSAEHEARYFDDMLKALSKRHAQEPVQFVLCPTYACNLKCTYCFEGETTAGPARMMTSEEVASAFAAIDVIRSDIHPGARASLVLYGGEPLMPPNRPCLERILEEAESRQLGVEVVTNGVQANEVLDFLRPKQHVIQHVQITIDGPAEIHDRRRPLRGGGGTFRRIAENVAALLERKLPVTIRVNVDRENLAHVPELMSYMEEQGWTLYPNFSCYLYPVTAYNDPHRANIIDEAEVLGALQKMFRGEAGQLPGFALYGFKVLAHVASVLEPKSLPLKVPPLSKYCEANGLRYFAFGPDGLMYPCGQAVGKEALAIGRYHPTLELRQEQCDQWAERSIRTVPQCRDCSIATLCGGGCAYGAWGRTGSIMEPNCQQCEATLDAYVGRWIENLPGRV